jgi:hypothetical protein
MTQDEIIEMARQAGVRDDDFCFEFSEYKYLDRFARLIAGKAARIAYPIGVRDERELCAKVADGYANGLDRNYSELIADAIRARGQA